MGIGLWLTEVDSGEVASKVISVLLMGWVSHQKDHQEVGVLSGLLGDGQLCKHGNWDEGRSKVGRVRFCIVPEGPCDWGDLAGVGVTAAPPRVGRGVVLIELPLNHLTPRGLVGYRALLKSA